MKKNEKSLGQNVLYSSLTFKDANQSYFKKNYIRTRDQYVGSFGSSEYRIGMILFVIGLSSHGFVLSFHPKSFYIN